MYTWVSVQETHHSRERGSELNILQMKYSLQGSAKRVPSYGGTLSTRQFSGSDPFLSRFLFALFIGLIKETRLVFLFETKLLFLFELLQAFFWCW